MRSRKGGGREGGGGHEAGVGSVAGKKNTLEIPYRKTVLFFIIPKIRLVRNCVTNLQWHTTM